MSKARLHEEERVEPISDSIPANDTHMGVADEEQLYQSIRRYWHPISYSADLTEDRPIGITLLGEQLAIVRLSGGVRAFKDICPHRGTALSLGWVENDRLCCAYCGWKYGSDGRCTEVPAHSELEISPKACLTSHLAVERTGLIWVCLDDEPKYPVPAYPEFDDPLFRAVRVPPYEWECSAARRVENLVDFGHFAWVHDGLLGDRNLPEVPDHDVRREGATLCFGEADKHQAHEDEEPERSKDRDGLPHKTGALLADKTYQLTMPFTVLLNQRLPGNRLYQMFWTVSPTGPRQSRTFTIMGRNYELDVDQDRKFLEFNDLVIGQDRPIIESQRPEELPVDLSSEIQIRGADRVAVEYRRWLRELAYSNS